MKKIYFRTRLLLCMCTVLFILFPDRTRADIPFDKQITFRSYNLLSPSVPLSNLIKDRTNIRVSHLTAAGKRTSSIELYPETDGASVTFVFPRENTYGTGGSTKPYSLHTVFLNPGEKPVAVSVSYTYTDGRTFSCHSVAADPGLKRQVLFQSRSCGVPRMLTVTFPHTTGNPLIIESVKLRTASYDLKMLQHSLEQNPDPWKTYITDNPTEEMEHVLDILALIHSPEAVKILAGLLRNRRTGPYAFKRLQPLSPLMKKYAFENMPYTSGDRMSPLAPALLRGSHGWNISPLITRLTSAEQLEEIREAVSMAISRPADYALVDTYFALLKDPSDFIKLHTILALKQLRPVGAFDNLVKLLDHPELSRSAVQAIGTIGSIKTVEPLLKSLQKPHLAWTAARYLKDFNLTASLQILKKCALSEHADVREAAAFLFGYTLAEEPDISGRILRMLIEDPSPRVRSRAAFSFARAASPEFLPYLHRMLEDRDAHVVIQAVRAIGQTANYGSLPFLTACYSQCKSVTAYAFREELEKMKGTEPASPARPDIPFYKSSSAPAPAPETAALFRRTSSVSLEDVPVPLTGETLKDSPLTYFLIPGFIEPCTVSIFTPDRLSRRRIQITDFAASQGDIIHRKDISVFVEEHTAAGRFLKKSCFLSEIKPGKSRRIWIFFDLSSRPSPGIYRGSLHIREVCKADITIHVLPWKKKQISNRIFLLPAERPLSSFENSIVSSAFPCLYFSASFSYNEDENGRPRLPGLTGHLARTEKQVFLNLGPAVSSEYRGNRDSYVYHIPPLHMKRLVKSVLYIQSFCRRNNLKSPVYMVNTNLKRKDTDESALITALLKRARSVSGVDTLRFCTPEELASSSTRFSVQTEGIPDLRTREHRRNRGQYVYAFTDTDTAPEYVRKRLGIYEWITESDGHVFYYVPQTAGKQVPEAIPLHLIAAAEGIKDLRLLKSLESMIYKMKEKEKNADRIKNILRMEGLFFRLKTGLIPNWNDPEWKRLDTQILRRFLINSLMLLEQEITL